MDAVEQLSEDPDGYDACMQHVKCKHSYSLPHSSCSGARSRTEDAWSQGAIGHSLDDMLRVKVAQDLFPKVGLNLSDVWISGSKILLAAGSHKTCVAEYLPQADRQPMHCVSQILGLDASFACLQSSHTSPNKAFSPCAESGLSQPLATTFLRAQPANVGCNCCLLCSWGTVALRARIPAIVGCVVNQQKINFCFCGVDAWNE